QHHPDASQPDEGFAMALSVLSLSHSGAEEVMKQSSRPGRVSYYEGYVADRFEHTTLRETGSASVIRHSCRPPPGQDPADASSAPARGPLALSRDVSWSDFPGTSYGSALAREQTDDCTRVL